MNEMTWGLQRDDTPRFGVRLVQESNRLHYLSDRASITGKFSDVECLRLDEAFPHFVRQMELMLTAKWHLNRSQFGIRIDHDLASISDHSLASQSITIWHASDH